MPPHYVLKSESFSLVLRLRQVKGRFSLYKSGFRQRAPLANSFLITSANPVSIIIVASGPQPLLRENFVAARPGILIEVEVSQIRKENILLSRTDNEQPGSVMKLQSHIGSEFEGAAVGG